MDPSLRQHIGELRRKELLKEADELRLATALHRAERWDEFMVRFFVWLRVSVFGRRATSRSARLHYSHALLPYNHHPDSCTFVHPPRSHNRGVPVPVCCRAERRARL